MSIPPSPIFSSKSIKSKILIDDVDSEPTTEYQKIAVTLGQIIKNSDPHFTIGIYGEWGTGKTTMMRLIENSLKNKQNSNEEILTIWFNAWRYEREEQIATVALMKTIGFAMENTKFEKVGETVLKSLRIIGKDFLRQLALTILTEKGVEEFEKDFSEKLKFLSAIEQDTIYFDGLEEIKKQMQNLRNQKKGKNYRVVVFIDDLDRCSPSKALEVLESIKVFLDIEGFVYVIGLSHQTISKLVTIAYEKTGIRGEDYLKKIIQIPVKLPTWHDLDIKTLFNESISKKLSAKLSRLISENFLILSRVVENNPRQLKRFINNLIIGFECYGKDKPNAKFVLSALFTVKILKMKFPTLFTRYSKNELDRQHINLFFEKLNDDTSINQYGELIYSISMSANNTKEFVDYLRVLPTHGDSIEIQKERASKILRMISRKTKTMTGQTKMNYFSSRRRVARELARLDLEDWSFIRKYSTVLQQIHDWQFYDNATEILEEINMKEEPQKTKNKSTSKVN